MSSQEIATKQALVEELQVINESFTPLHEQMIRTGRVITQIARLAEHIASDPQLQVRGLFAKYGRQNSYMHSNI
jgi:hypothetical protein